jgi:prepilin-type N-terminal cleavage/methylation domain-containing protein
MRQRAGFTLVEVILSIVIMSIVMYAVIGVYITSGFKGVNVEAYTVAQALSESVLEEAMSRSFASVADVPETAFSAEALSEYTYEIVADYVSREALDAAVAGPTDYKKITVRIRHPRLGNPIDLASLKADI